MIDWPEDVIPFFETLDENQRVAGSLVWLANRAADPSFKSKYRMRWWGILEASAKLAAKTSGDLTEWSNSVCGRLQGKIGRNEADRRLWWALLEGVADADAVLRSLDVDALTLCSLVQLDSAHRREKFEREMTDLDEAHGLL